MDLVDAGDGRILGGRGLENDGRFEGGKLANDLLDFRKDRKYECELICVNRDSRVLCVMY